MTKTRKKTRKTFLYWLGKQGGRYDSVGAFSRCCKIDSYKPKGNVKREEWITYLNDIKASSFIKLAFVRAWEEYQQYLKRTNA